MCWAPHALADTADDTEIALQETPQALYDKLSREFPKGSQINSREQLQQLARGLMLQPEQLLDNMLLLVRLNLHIQLKKSHKEQDARQLLDQLQHVVQGNYERAAWLNLEGRYQGRFKQNYRATIELNNQALTLLADTSDRRSLLLKFVIYEDVGIVNLMTKNAQAALNNLILLRDTARQLQNDYLIAEAETQLGKYFRAQNQLNQALQHYTDAYRIASKVNRPYQKAMLQLNLAKLYRDLEQWPDALAYTHQAIESFKTLGLDTYLSSSMTVIATVYANQGDWNKAIDYYLNAQQIDAELQNFTAQGLNFHNIGEAYFKLGNTQNALDYLHQANKIFRDRNSNHYLVYNELLIAQVAATRKAWAHVLAHAQNAEKLAAMLKLNGELIEALEYQVKALQSQGDDPAILGLQSRIIALQQSSLDQQKAQQHNNSAKALNGQQLALKLTQLEQQNRHHVEVLNSRDYLISAILLLLLFTSSYCLYLLRERVLRKRELAATQQLTLTDPRTNLPGFRAFMQALQQPHQASALLAVRAQFEQELQQGHLQLTRRQQLIYNQLRHQTDARLFSLGAGLYALVFDKVITLPTLQQQLAKLTCQKQRQLTSMSFIAMPLLGDTEVHLPAETLYETLQFALAGCMSLDGDENHYVALSTLDFTSSSIFSEPLYPSLGKAIERGLIRVDCDVPKNAIRWPGQPDADTLTEATDKTD
ncbi:tetratricopeptide repeat protein [Shewanella sp. YIC-542]|uniref:tetratricopeptide repeat protein n=1 Tax=Shewanella mytili TaxID=3377111 RepID=UPI00398F577A